MCLGRIVQSLHLRLHDERTARLIECNRRAANGCGVYLRYGARAFEIRKAQDEIVGQDLPTQFASRHLSRVNVDVQSTGKQSIDAGSVKGCPGRHGEERRIARVLIERHENPTIGAGKRVMNMRCSRRNAVDGEVALHIAGDEVYCEIGLRRSLRINRRHLLLTTRRNSELKDVLYGDSRIAGQPDVACGVVGLGAQGMVAFGCGRRIPVKAERRRGVAAKKDAVDEEAHLNDADVVRRSHGKRYNSIDRCPGRCLDRGDCRQCGIGWRWRRCPPATTTAATAADGEQHNKRNPTCQYLAIDFHGMIPAIYFEL